MIEYFSIFSKCLFDVNIYVNDNIRVHIQIHISSL